MDKLSNFWNDYKGAIIGVVIVLLLLLTRLYQLIIIVALVILGAIAGNYVQQNKEDIKEKLKNFIDRI